jgi:predicted dehydrogenase
MKPKYLIVELDGTEIFRLDISKKKHQTVEYTKSRINGKSGDVKMWLEDSKGEFYEITFDRLPEVSNKYEEDSYEDEYEEVEEEIEEGTEEEEDEEDEYEDDEEE